MLGSLILNSLLKKPNTSQTFELAFLLDSDEELK